MNNALKASIVALIIAVCLIVFLFKSRTGKLVGNFELDYIDIRAPVLYWHDQKYGWTKNILVHLIEGKSYERFLLGQTNFDKTVEKKYQQQAKRSVRDESDYFLLFKREWAVNKNC